MVKVRDLTEKQLLAQLEKYEKVYSLLINERRKRIKNGLSLSPVLTALERKKGGPLCLERDRTLAGALSQQSSDPEETRAFYLDLDDSEIEKMNRQSLEEKAKKEEDQEVGVTQLLNLNKEQLQEFRKGAKKKG